MDIIWETFKASFSRNVWHKSPAATYYTCSSSSLSCSQVKAPETKGTFPEMVEAISQLYAFTAVSTVSDKDSYNVHSPEEFVRQRYKNINS